MGQRRLIIYPLILLMSFSLLFLNGKAQQTFPFNGLKDHRTKHYALKNATIIKAPGDTIKKGTLLIKEGKIQAVGSNVDIPQGAAKLDLNEKYIYPSFVDLYTSYGLPTPEKIGADDNNKKPQMVSDKLGAFGWNEALKPEYNAHEHFSIQEEQAKKWRKLGFGTVQSLLKDGIARGASVLVTLGEERPNQEILQEQAAAQYSFDKGEASQAYPNSLMGAMALLRQTQLDAQWYQQAKQYDKVETNISLAAWNRLQSLPQMIAIDDKLSTLRADKLFDEWNQQCIIKTNGDGYQRINAMKNTGTQFVLPLTFPKPYDVEDPYDALEISFYQLKHWDLAPSNPARFAKHDIPFALTATGLEKPKKFKKKLRKAFKHGLSRTDALKALTVTPSRMLNVEDQIGTLEEGKVANFLVTSGDIFSKKETIFQNWVQGQPYFIDNEVDRDVRGTYRLTISEGAEYTLRLKGKVNKPKAKIQFNDTIKRKAYFNKQEELVTISFPLKEDTSQSIRLSGWRTSDTSWSGTGQRPDGGEIQWSAYKTAPYTSEKEKPPQDTPNAGLILYPFKAYGWETLPEQEKVLFKNATVWTNESAGIIDSGDVLIAEGVIQKVGKNLQANDAKVIDAAGQHLTCGIVDEHAHIAISQGVNEGSQAITSEVRIGDVVNSSDVNIYRQLAGGVTTSHLLHGSANPIGGQNEIIKMRWGQLPTDMKMEAAPPFIKFALGENVKQSNWGNEYTKRYPQTRMGVEQIMYDAFQRALDYEARQEQYNNMSNSEQARTVPPRPNLELDALLEVLKKERFITCHSYVQSEVKMMMEMADSFGFTLNTFTHILEGYKVADEMAQHGAGGSTFSDWWAYKFEVIDAIPFNATIMNNVGVTTAINSDDAEMGRRLNQEAAKAMKYGGLSEQEAWKLVTLNPAKLLHIEDEVGSIRAGKAADLVLWSDHPLSIDAKAQKTYVDGKCLFDRSRSKERQQWMQEERHRIIQKMITAKENGEETQKPHSEKQRIYDCETIGGYPK